ncbi:MAG: hypothetical protein AB7O96_03780 [Pseudobdellovibrionaceae bacterium]
MDLKTLDFVFPFFVLAYGIFMVLALETPALQKLAEKRLPDGIKTQLNNNRIFAWISLVIGCFWSVQNIWLS